MDVPPRRRPGIRRRGGRCAMNLAEPRERHPMAAVRSAHASNLSMPRSRLSSLSSVCRLPLDSRGRPRQNRDDFAINRRASRLWRFADRKRRSHNHENRCHHPRALAWRSAGTSSPLVRYRHSMYPVSPFRTAPLLALPSAGECSPALDMRCSPQPHSFSSFMAMSEPSTPCHLDRALGVSSTLAPSM